MNDTQDSQSTSFHDVKQMGLFAALGSLGYVFWVVGGMASNTGDTPASLTELLYTTHNIGLVWHVLGVIGIITAIGIWQYGRWILTLKTDDRQ